MTKQLEKWCEQEYRNHFGVRGLVTAFLAIDLSMAAAGYQRPFKITRCAFAKRRGFSAAAIDKSMARKAVTSPRTPK